jgi:hypothetical protein
MVTEVCDRLVNQFVHLEAEDSANGGIDKLDVARGVAHDHRLGHAQQPVV